MIFGFNTDIKHEGTVYHVQSEAREHDKLLQTQVFVRGRCIGKHANSYAEQMAQPGFSDEHMHDLLKTQHKSVIDAIRSGGLDQLFGALTPPASDSVQPAAASAAAQSHHAPEPPKNEKLTLLWINSDKVYEDNTVVMRFSVMRNGSGVAGAQLTTRVDVPEEAPIYSQTTTAEDGTAELKILLGEHALHNAAVLVQAMHAGDHSTRKFRLRKQA